MTQPVTLITGATSGIGLEFARLCAAEAQDLVLVARNADELAKTAAELETKYKIKVRVFARDLSVLAEAETVVANLEQENVEVAVLINNAGFGEFGLFKDTDWKKEEQMIRLNIIALTYLTKVYSKKMISAGKGKILNVASVAGFMPGPLMAVYYATKAYVLSFSEALANELRATGVTVTVLCPGPTATGFQKAASLEDSGMVKNKRLPTAMDVARAGYKGMQHGKTVVLLGGTNRLFVFLIRILPRNFVTRAVRFVQESW